MKNYILLDLINKSKAPVMITTCDIINSIKSLKEILTDAIYISRYDWNDGIKKPDSNVKYIVIERINYLNPTQLKKVNSFIKSCDKKIVIINEKKGTCLDQFLDFKFIKYEQ